MVIFKYELKNHRKYILSWAFALAICIFMMTPVYYSLFGGAESTSNPLYDTLGKTDFFQSTGVSMEYLTSSLGIYSFLTSFFMVASGIFGLHFGISIHTKEFSEKTSEYLQNRMPVKRYFGQKRLLYSAVHLWLEYSIYWCHFLLCYCFMQVLISENFF